MRIQKECQICGTKFTAIKTNQYFCQRRCFKKAYNIRKREERRKERETNPARFGYYNCSFCLIKSIMPFSIKRYPQKWADFRCPECNVQRLENSADPRQVWYWESPTFRGGVPMVVQTYTSMVSSIVKTLSSTLYGAPR